MVSVVAYDSDQNSVVVTVGLCGSLMITLSVPRIVGDSSPVVANDFLTKTSVVVTVGLYGSLIMTESVPLDSWHGLSSSMTLDQNSVVVTVGLWTLDDHTDKSLLGCW